MMVTGPKMRAVGDVKFSTYFESTASGIFGSPDKGSERKTANYSKTFDVGHWKNGITFRLDGLSRRQSGLVEMSGRTGITSQVVISVRWP